MKISISVSQHEDNERALRETGFWGRAGAGCLLYCRETDRFLVPLRSKEVLQPGTYGTWGGAVNDGETPSVAALREMREECGYRGEVEGVARLFVYTKGQFAYTTFVAVVPAEFEPRLNWETERADWLTLTQLRRRKLHFGLAALLRDKVAVAIINRTRRA